MNNDQNNFDGQEQNDEENEILPPNHRVGILEQRHAAKHL